jgi:hypothetical protein
MATTIRHTEAARGKSNSAAGSSRRAAAVMAGAPYTASAGTAKAAALAVYPP